MTLHGCSGAPPHVPTCVRQVLDSTLVIESSPINLLLRGHHDPHPQPHSDELLVMGLSEIEVVHIRFKRFFRIEKCRKMWSYADFYCDVMFFIVVNNLPHAIRYYRLRWWARWKLLIPIKVFYRLLSLALTLVLYNALLLKYFRQQFSSYVYHSNSLYEFSMCWWNCTGKKVSIAIRKFRNVSIVIVAVRALLF